MRSFVDTRDKFSQAGRFFSRPTNIVDAQDATQSSEASRGQLSAGFIL